MLRDTFLEDSKIFHESFIYGIHFAIVEKTDSGFKMTRLKKKKGKLFGDTAKKYFLPTGILMENDTYQVGDWIFGTQTDKKIAGKKIFNWELLGQFANKEGKVFKDLSRMLKKGIAIELGEDNE